jgi:hypothetical protein
MECERRELARGNIFMHSKHVDIACMKATRHGGTGSDIGGVEHLVISHVFRNKTTHRSTANKSVRA